jgi:alanine-glyoxylate transaminase/(R)-3-amino-2-methylpropionate-pyruvate transaminase
MQHVWDSTGKQYLDLIGGIVTVSIGHCHPKVMEAVTKQMKKFWHTTHIYYQSPIHEYAEKLASKMPGNLKVCYFVNSGSEATDMALTLARLHTNNLDVVSLRNGYHGLTSNIMGMASLSYYRQRVAHNNLHQSINPDVYRGPWGGSDCRDSPVQTVRSCSCSPGQCAASSAYFEQLEDLFRHCIPKNGAAAFIAESIQGGGGTVQFPKGYLAKAADLVRAYGGLYIADEVQTGFGRTGEHFWGFEGHGVQPDIVTMAKGIGNGFPLAAVVTTPEIAKSLASAAHFNTFGGNPLATTAGKTVLEVIEEEGLQENAADVGTYFLSRLGELQHQSDVIGDVRGKGLMIGVELVKNKESREPLEPEKVAKIFEATKDNGLLLGLGGQYKNVLRIKPPMCLTRENVDFTMKIFQNLLKSL